MTRRDLGTVAAVAFAAGLAGGAMSSGLLTERFALAQQPSPAGRPNAAPAPGPMPRLEITRPVPTRPEPPAKEPESHNVVANLYFLQDKDGTKRGTLSVEAFGPALTLYDTNGKVRVRLAVAETGNPFLQFFDENQKGNLRIGPLDGESQGTPGIALYGKDIGRGARLGPVDPAGRMGLQVWTDGKSANLIPK